MNKTGIAPGTALALQLERKKDTEPDFTLFSTFEADLGQGLLLISAPFYRGDYFPILLGDELSFTYFTELGRYHFQGVYQEPDRQGNLLFLVFRRSSEILRTQRRDDFRLSVSLKGSLSLLSRGETPLRQKPQKIITADISGGGASIHTDKRLQPEDEVILSLPLGAEGRELRLRATVCRVHENPLGHAHRYSAGLRFIYESPMLKDQVIRRVFKLQQQHRSRLAEQD